MNKETIKIIQKDYEECNQGKRTCCINCAVKAFGKKYNIGCLAVSRMADLEMMKQEQTNKFK